MLPSTTPHRSIIDVDGNHPFEDVYRASRTHHTAESVTAVQNMLTRLARGILCLLLLLLRVCGLNCVA